MKASALISTLQSDMDQHGDVEVTHISFGQELPVKVANIYFATARERSQQVGDTMPMFVIESI